MILPNKSRKGNHWNITGAHKIIETTRKLAHGKARGVGNDQPKPLHRSGVERTSGLAHMPWTPMTNTHRGRQQIIIWCLAWSWCHYWIQTRSSMYLYQDSKSQAGVSDWLTLDIDHILANQNREKETCQLRFYYLMQIAICQPNWHLQIGKSFKCCVAKMKYNHKITIIEARVWF